MYLLILINLPLDVNVPTRTRGPHLGLSGYVLDPRLRVTLGMSVTSEVRVTFGGESDVRGQDPFTMETIIQMSCDQAGECVNDLQRG